MERVLRILMVEDMATDAELEIRELKRAGMRVVHQIVETEATFREALREFRPELILSDFSMPHFDGMWALEIARTVVPDVPFIFVSGTIGEEYAIRALRNGATDYVLKNNLVRLPAAVERALQDNVERTARRKAELELEETRSRLDSIVSSLSDVVWSVSISPYRMQYASRAFEAVWGVPVGKLYQNPDLRIEAIHPDDRGQVENTWRNALRGEPFDAVYRIVRGDGAVRWIHDRAKSIYDGDGNIVRLDGIARDITELKVQEQRITRLSRIQAVLSGINSLIVRVRDRQKLLAEACRIAVNHGGFGIAWIGMVDPKTLEVIPAACAGIEANSLMATSRNTVRADTPLGQGMVGRAIREKRPVFSNDLAVETSPGGARRQEAVRRGYRSLISLPLVVEDKAVGCLSLFAKEPNFFDEEEYKLLTELAGNISFALEHIGKEEKIARLSRIQAVMSGINSAIVRVRDQQKLLEEACRIAVDYGNFGTAWIGTLDPQTLDVTPVACVGPGAQEFLDGYKCSARSDDATGQGIVGQAIRACKPVFSNDGLREPGRRNVAVTLGYHSRIALPLRVTSGIVGIIVLFAKEPDFFTDEEIGQLTELADNISFALDHIRKGEALVESEKKLDNILSTLQEVVWSMDPESGRLVYVNAAVKALTQRSVVDFLAQPRLWRSLVHRDDRVSVRSAIRKLLQDGRLTHEFRIVLADGEERTVESSARVRYDDAGKAVRIDGTISDITERKSAEENLRRLNEELEDKVTARTVDLERARHEAENANQAKSSFLATMSHEIRTPMNGVIGMVDVLHQTSLRGDQVEMVELIRESAFSLLGIINDILDFSKIEAGKLELDEEAVAVAEVVEGVCNLLNGMAEKKGVVLTLFTDPAIPAQVLGDALRLRQVLINLVNNAIKFSSGQSRAGRVSIRALLVEQSAQWVTVEFQVTDNGIGMDEETQERLFTAFTQADVSTTRRFGGTGLGLAIANNLVELMGGEIAVQSVPGEGATFKIRVPMVPAPAQSSAVEVVSEVAGLSCVVVGAAGGLADDLASYLEHAHAVVERAPDLASARVSSANRSGLTVCVVDAGDERRSPAQMRAAVGGLNNQDIGVAFIFIERGKRRRPRAVAPDMITVDGNALSRCTFLKAVAAAAGRASLETGAEAPASGTLAMIAPSRADALRQGRLILIAEDNETNQKVILRQLALLGYTADVVDNGSDALKRWQSGNYALLLTDLHMPQMDGYELTQAIRAAEQENQHIPIVALTANALKGEAEHCRAVGMDDYRSKPSPLAELKSVLDKWLPVVELAANAAASSTTATQQGATAVPVDVKVLMGLVGDDPDLVREFLQDFRASAAKIAVELRAGCTAGQTTVVVAAAHKLKSSARSVGAFALGELCAAMEDDGRAGDADALAVLLPRFEAEMALVEDYLDTF